MFKYSNEEIKKLNANIYILMSYHEEFFAQKVYQINSYSFKDIEYDVKFISASSFDDLGFTVLDHDLLSEVEKLD